MPLSGDQMADNNLRKMSELIVSYWVEVEPRDEVLIQANVTALPLVAEHYKAILRKEAIHSPCLKTKFYSKFSIIMPTNLY